MMCRARTATLAGALLVSVLLAPGCVYRIAEKDLFVPRRAPLMDEMVHRRNVEVRAADGTALRGWFLSPPGARRALLYFYGNGETVNGSAPLLYRLAERLEANVLAVDYRGYGFSDGTPGLEGIAADAPLLYDMLAGLTGPGRPIIVYGRSLGTVFAIRAAVERPVSALILQAPPSTIADVVAAWQKRLRWYLRPFVFLRPAPQLVELEPQPVDDIARVTSPLLVVHGANDRAIPLRLGRRVFDAAGSTAKSLCEVAGAGHNDLDVLRGPAALCISRFVESIAYP